MRSPRSQLSLFPDGAAALHLPAFSVRKSARAKRLTIKVFPRGRVEVVVPRRTRAADVQAFVAENAGWIREARNAFAVEHLPEDLALPSTIRLRALGRTVRVRYVRRRDLRSVRCRTVGQVLELTGPVDDESACLAALRRWLCQLARVELEPQLERLAARMRTPYRKLQIRAQRTCWGSHSSSGTISLNFCLLFLKPELVRYLMVHELAHGRHMNHSARFWKLVEQFEPDYERLDKALTDSWREVPAWLGIY
ncbi:MAG TPA: SprT family zinc-dependent metalloprotease [Woeseiaceae bacterium]|nr:SprT family zinc-dependent metalloprotease [Woeseiaceae bacterium]